MDTTTAPTTTATTDTATSHNEARKATSTPPRRRTARLAAVIFAIVAGLIASASPASAWQYAWSTGQPGAVTATAQVQVGKLSYFGLGPRVTLFGETGPTVSRSPATTGAQDITILYSVQRWNGSQWVQVTYQLNRARMAAGVQQGRLPALYAQPSAGTGYYRVEERFTWTVAGTDTVLGTTAIVPNLASDHRCLYSPCAATAGYVWAG